ncbi:type II toxin-antitoxin system HipA family toxin [Caulobacter mirabilis]|uniref:Phosphatidylinositol kinase n=1 Tax=Caulobacter mirabilis TaxID=69666 RepID=A0A2D2AZG2_9CAUL|nr:type II toxin-antitoxin system HipA family toxin [Caulobacter mirabilis]ATQ43384.1 phosphatidylinositol kinase [Caulobacter mirabilis]
MRLPRGTPLSVGLMLEDAAPALPTARLAMDASIAQLEWSPEIIARGLRLAALDTYPPERGLQAARGRTFDGLHGFLTDSLPDGWGYLVMRRRLAKLGVDIASLTPLERLALVGEQGRGALVFAPATAPDDPVETLDLDALSDAATTLLAGEADGLADTLAGLAGGSGGARPKVHVGFDAQGAISVGTGESPPGFAPWIVKFRAPEDPEDIGPIEGAYADMARAAGLTLSSHRLLPARNGPAYFATRRFDRPDGGGRRHMVSLAGALEAPADRPSASYDTFLRATRAITRQADDVAEAFRRMLFNILASNRDDHTRQHAYLMDPAGDWRLSPAYDLTYAPGPGGEHYMDIEGEGRRPTRVHVETLGERHGFDRRRIALMIDETRAAIETWPRLAAAVDVSRTSSELIGKAHDRVWAEFKA